MNVKIYMYNTNMLQGEEGVCEVLSILKEELRQAMVLSGTPNISSITKDLVMHRSHAKL